MMATVIGTENGPYLDQAFFVNTPFRMKGILEQTSTKFFQHTVNIVDS